MLADDLRALVRCRREIKQGSGVIPEPAEKEKCKSGINLMSAAKAKQECGICLVPRR